MAQQFWSRIAGTWRQATEVWFRNAGAWQNARQVWFRDAGAWQQVFTNTTPTLTSGTASGQNGTDVSPVDVGWTFSGVATGYTLTIETAWTGGGYSTAYTGSNGGSSPQAVAYWGAAFSPPANAGEALSMDALVRISLKDSGGNHVSGSPRIRGPGIPI